jgi:hypothetical protein
LNIPYKGFRNWESTDKLFKATAKFISLEKNEINLEKADGKKTTIELSVLRKEDQDYIKQQKDVESIEKTLDKIASQTKDYANAAKSIQDSSVYKKPETIDNVLDIFERQYRSLKNIIYYFTRLDDVAAVKLRPAISTEWLSFRMILNESFDTNHDFSVPVYLNLHVYGYVSGIDPKYVKEPELRKDYEERLAKNTQLAYERRVQHTLRQLREDATKEMEKFICNAYERKPRADQELIDLLEKYKYPEVERIELLCKLNIPYKGFRNWESNDKLFKATAKFISLEKDEVNLEKADSKKTTIELSVLRKEDQDYIKQQLKPKPSH